MGLAALGVAGQLRQFRYKRFGRAVRVWQLLDRCVKVRPGEARQSRYFAVRLDKIWRDQVRFGSYGQI